MTPGNGRSAYSLPVYPTAANSWNDTPLWHGLRLARNFAQLRSGVDADLRRRTAYPILLNLGMLA